VTFINHSTVLLQIGTLNLITDPIYAKRASPFSFAGPKRAHPPGIRFDDLPPIDAILLSHNHYDHCCVRTLRRLLERDRPAIYTGRGVRPLLESVGFEQVVEMNWWECIELRPDTMLTYVPARHFSGRGLFDRNKTLWGGFFLTAPEAKVYFAGDTADGPHFEAIRERLGTPDLALLPIGAYEPPEIMKPVHTNPEEAVDAHLRLGARHSVAIHFGTFPLTDEGQWDPPERLDRALSAAGLTGNDFWVLDFGEGRDLPPAR
jgi:L-ascorbate metabolism protein UlaG (beta-lactamase superfamily)